MTDLLVRWQHALQDNYGTPSVALVRGSGSRVWDESGKDYVDFLAGIATNCLGHAHPDVVAAVAQQASVLGHVSNLYAHPQGVRLAERLVAALDPTGARGGRAFFCNSGAEANEAAFKLTRLTGRTRVVVAANSFHGRTMGSLALTAQPAKQDPFRPLPGDVVVVPYGDVVAIHEALDDSIAAVFLEPIQGEGGVVVPPDGYLRDVRAACDRVGALLVLDEVQTGMGRTGMRFDHQRFDVQPDVVTLAKGLAAGMPMGAMVAFGRAAELFHPGSHGSTFGANPVCAAAANVVLDHLEVPKFLGRVLDSEAAIRSAVTGWSVDRISHVRGRGLLLGIVLSSPVARNVEAAARDRGVLVNAAQPDVIRLAPPLNVSDEELSDGLARLYDAFAEVDHE